MLRKITAALRTLADHIEIGVAEADFQSDATRLLRGKLFHVTAAHNVPSIISSGAILPNNGGIFRRSFTGSALSYGGKRGYVSLFDFRHAEDEAIGAAFEKYILRRVHDAFAHRPTFLILQDPPNVEIIPWTVAQEETEGRELFIPRTECWSAAPVTVAMIAAGIHMRVHPHPSDGSLADRHARDVIALTRREFRRRSRVSGR